MMRGCGGSFGGGDDGEFDDVIGYLKYESLIRYNE